MQSQSQKEVTHNSSLEIIDMLLHPIAIDIGINTPPKSAETQESHTANSDTGDNDTQESNTKDSKDCYIVGTTPRDAWKDHPNTLAYFEDSAWKFIEPFEGLTVWVREKKQQYIYDGTKWLSIFEVIENERKKRKPVNETLSSNESDSREDSREPK